MPPSSESSTSTGLELHVQSVLVEHRRVCRARSKTESHAVDLIVMYC